MAVNQLCTFFMIALATFGQIDGYIPSEHPAYQPFCSAIRLHDTQTIQDIINAQENKKDFMNEGLYRAADEKDIDLVRYFLQIGANVNAKDAWSWTPLHVAAANGSVSCAQALLDAGGDMNALTYWCQNSPLYIAVGKKQFDMVKLLVRAGARLDIQSYWFKQTITHAAIEAHDVQILEYLIQAGAPLNSRDTIGRTPLMFAADCKYIRLVDILIAAQAKITEQDIVWIEESWKKQANAQTIATETNISKKLRKYMSESFSA